MLAKRRLKRGQARLPGAVALKGGARDRRNVADNARCWGGDQPRAGRRKVPEMIRETQVEGTLHDRTKRDSVYEPIE
jgi:urease gamma subunit